MQERQRLRRHDTEDLITTLNNPLGIMSRYEHSHPQFNDKLFGGEANNDLSQLVDIQGSRWHDGKVLHPSRPYQRDLTSSRLSRQHQPHREDLPR